MEMVYEDDEIVLSKWAGVPGEHKYLLESKDEAHKKQGKGYLMLSPGALQRLCHALGNMVFGLLLLNGCASPAREQMQRAVDSTGLARWYDSTNGVTCYASRVYGGMTISCLKVQ